ncbi:VOC family protein [Lysinibacillus macroides]|nr:VOC family protein [Lysinibacillus macroides]
MMVGVEIDMVVTDSLKALALYEKIFDIERVEVTDFPVGKNEVVFKLYDVRFHMLDENPEYQMIAPKPDDPKPIWFNILVPNIAETYEKAINAGCKEVQPVTKMPDFGISNAMFSDEFGYLWMLHELHRVVSFEERVQILAEDGNQH